MHGHLIFEKYTPDWKLVERVDCGWNTLTRIFYNNYSHLLAGDSTDNYVAEMQFGSGSSSPSVDDTTLQQPITPTDVPTVDHPDTNSTRFSAYLMEDEANGFPISEVGLLDGEGNLMARKTLSGQVKNSDYIFGFRWTISTT